MIIEQANLAGLDPSEPGISGAERTSRLITQTSRQKLRLLSTVRNPFDSNNPAGRGFGLFKCNICWPPPKVYDCKLCGWETHDHWRWQVHTFWQPWWCKRAMDRRIREASR